MAAGRSASARRRAILGAARELFLERGYAATTCADVVARSGGSLATLYALFGTKRGLFEAILRDYSEAVMRPLCVDGISTDPEQGLLAIGKRYLALELTRFPVKLIGFVRHGIRCDDPAEEATVAAGDVIVLAGADPKLEAAEQYLLAGTEPAAPPQRTAG